MPNLKQIIEENDILFDRKVNELRQDQGTEEVKEFGYKFKRGNELFTATDWGNIEKFIHSSQLRLIEGFREMVREIFYEFNDKEQDFECNQKVIKLRNDILSELGSINEIK